MHPLFSAVVSRPGMLLEHVGAYAELASVELEETVSRHRRRFMVSAVMWLLVCLATTLVGVSVMFHVVFADTLSTQKAWVLWLPPVVPLLAALGCHLWLRRAKDEHSFDQLLKQVRQDIDWLQQQEQPHG